MVSALRNNVRTIGDSRPKKLRLGFAFLLCFVLNTSSSIADMDSSKILGEYGEVIYRCNEKSPNQLFVIGMSHRDALTGSSLNHLSRIQAEVYKLGEWLVQKEGLELLLPEGFFTTPAAKIEKKQSPGKTEKTRDCPESFDIKSLEEKLSDTKTFINAELLLKRNYSLTMRQVEDNRFYQAVSASIRKLAGSGNNACDYLQVRSELDYLQERRTAAMLQRIPEIVDAEFNGGNIRAKKAIFTIGLSHLPMIIRYLDENRIRIYSPLFSPNKNEDYTAVPNLRKENFGVTILIPKTLAGDQKILRANKLDKIVAHSRDQSSALPFGSTREILSY